MKIPTYNLTFNEDSVIDFVSIVNIGAMDKQLGVTFIQFADISSVNLSILDEEKREILGVVMAPDVIIPRYDDKKGAYNIVASRETVKNCMQFYMKHKKTDSFNLQHSDITTGLFALEVFLVDRELGIAPLAPFDKVPDGTWMMRSKVTDDSLWNDVKSGKYTGYSIEAMLNIECEFSNNQQPDNQTWLHKLEQMFKNKFVRKLFVKTFLKLGEITAEDGTVIMWDGDSVPAVGTQLMTFDENNEPVSLPEGEYMVDGSKWVVDESGLVTEIVPATEEPVTAKAETPTPESIGAQLADMIEPIVTALKKENKKLQAVNVALAARIEALEKKPAADPADRKPEFKENKKSKENLNDLINGRKP